MTEITILFLVIIALAWYFSVLICQRCDRIIETCDKMLETIDRIQKQLKD